MSARIVAEFARLNGILGPDSRVSAAVTAFQSGSGNEQELRNGTDTLLAETQAECDSCVAPIVAGGSVLSLTQAQQDAVELASWKLQRARAAENLLDSVWPSGEFTHEDGKNGARDCLSNGHGGVKCECTAKRNQKKEELLGGGEKLIAEVVDGTEQMVESQVP